MSQSVEVSSSCLNNSWFVSGDNGSIRVSNETIVSWGNSWNCWDSSVSSMGNWGNSSHSWGSVGSMSNSSLGTKVFSTGSGNGWFINWNNSSVGVTNELGVQVEGTSIAMGNSWDSSISSWSNWGSSIGSMSNWGGGNSWGSICSMSNNSLSTEMLRSSSSNSWLISWDNSSVGMGNEAVKWSCRSAGRQTTNNDLRILNIKYSNMLI